METKAPKINVWIRRCEEMLGWNPPQNKASYINGCLRMIRQNPDCFPTPAQLDVLKPIYLHLWRRNRTELEKQVMADLGITEPVW